MKKIVAGVLAVAAALTLVSCGGKSAKKGLNISVFTIQQRQQPPADNRDYKWIEEKFGVTVNESDIIDIQTVGEAAEYINSLK